MPQLKPQEPVTIDQDVLSTIYSRAQLVMERIRDGAVDPDSGERQGPTFPISKAATLVGRSASAIREAERDGRLPARERTHSGRRVQYSLNELDGMRALFETRPWRNPTTDTPAIISVSNFKGGVGKSTTAIHLAQYLAIRGYRVLLVDCDSQASSTMMFGYVPDRDLSDEDTLYGYIREPTLDGVRRLIRKTHFHGLDLIPANLRLYNLEYEIAATIMGEGSFAVIDVLAEALSTVVDDYDVVVMDPPPALGMVSLAVLNAANAMVIPVPPSIMDFSSTTSFIDMVQTTLRDLERSTQRRPVFNFIKLVGSKVDDQKSMHREILTMCRQVFGNLFLESIIRTSAEIDNASSRMKSVYELERPVTSHETHNRCVTHLEAVNYEIEREIIRMWPSRAKAVL